MASANPIRTSYSKRGYALVKKHFTEDELKKVRKELMVAPFTLDDFNKPEPFPVFLESPSKLYVPKHYGFEKFGNPDEVKMEFGDPINVQFAGTLKPIQENVIQQFMNSCIFENDEKSAQNYVTKSNGGIVSVGCGFGKTILTINLISRIARKALVVVHKEFLMNQWKERIAQFLPMARVGTIQGKIVDVKDKDIVLCMLQSLSMKEYDPSVFDGIGLIAIDECFPYKQSVVTENGPIRIGRLYSMWKNKEPLPLVKSYNENTCKFEWKRITHAWEKENNELIELQCSKMKFRSTPNHKYLTTHGWRSADTLQVGDLLIGNSDEFTGDQNDTIKIDAICHTTNDTYTDDESVYNKKVYDIEVEDNHNFVICGSTTTNGVVVHNCHHIAAEVFSRALPKINAYYSIGLSATPKRSDGLSKIFHMYLGPFIFRMEKRDDVKKIEIHAMHYYDTDESYSQEEYTVTQKLCLPKMINNIANHTRRNDMIEALVRRLVNLNEVEPRKIIILSDRREHLAELYRRCSKFATVGYYIGGMKQKDLNESEKKQVIFGTYPMSSEGLDIGDLNTCIFTTPKSSIEQSVGRIVRKNHAIPPLAFDIVDHFSMFPGQYKKRETVYRKLDYDIYDHTIRADESTSMSNLVYQVDQPGVLREPKKRGRKATSGSSASSCQSMKKEKDIFDLCFNTKDGDEDEDDESDEEENQNVDTMFRDD